MSLAAFRRPAPVVKDSFLATATSIETETAEEAYDEDTQLSTGVGVLEETQIQETVMEIGDGEFE
jgi:hypothetical protein